MGAPKALPPPTPQPVVPVPQPDDPRSLEAEQTSARAAANRNGATAHLLANPMGGGTGTLGMDEETDNFKRRQSAMLS